MEQGSVLVFGYGELCVAALEGLKEAGARVVGVVAPSNRSGPDVDLVRRLAERHALPLFVQPPRRAVEPFVAELRSLAPDLILVWSYSMILPASVLCVPRMGAVNLHGGLLPEYRGGHVLQWAIINGETETGMTLHYIDEGIDTGPIIAEQRFAIEWDDDAASIRGKLRSAGIRLIRDWWPAIINGTAPRMAQDESRARYYPMRTAEDGLINWSLPSREIYNLVRALVRPWPGAFTFSRGRKIIVRRAVPVEATTVVAGRVPGLVCGVEPNGFRVATGDGELLICEAEVDDAASGAFNLNGMKLEAGDLLGH